MILKELAERQKQFPPAFYDAVGDKVDRFGEWPEQPLGQLATFIAGGATLTGHGWLGALAAAPDVVGTALRSVAHDLDPLTLAIISTGFQGVRQDALDRVRSR